MRKSNLLLIMIFCLCLVGCSKEDNTVEGVFGFGETSVESSASENISEDDEDKFLIKEDVTLATEETEIDSDINMSNSLSSLQQDKINKIEKDLMSQNTEVTEEDVINLLTEEFDDLSDSEKEKIVSVIIKKVNNSSISETLDSSLVYKYATSYETDEIIIDEKAPSRSYSEEELEVMHSEAEKLYQKQQTAETFKFDD